MRLLIVVGSLLTLTSCDTAIGPFACTDDFRSVVVEVVNASGQPVPGLSTQSILERTGEPLASSGTFSDEDPAGVYIVATDADARGLRVDGDLVQFTASGADMEASAQFVLADDGCHIQKEEGPDRIVALPL